MVIYFDDFLTGLSMQIFKNKMDFFVASFISTADISKLVSYFYRKLFVVYYCFLQITNQIWYEKSGLIFTILFLRCLRCLLWSCI